MINNDVCIKQISSIVHKKKEFQKNLKCNIQSSISDAVLNEFCHRDTELITCPTCYSFGRTKFSIVAYFLNGKSLNF